jgi:hypothetical protein
MTRKRTQFSNADKPFQIKGTPAPSQAAAGGASSVSGTGITVAIELIGDAQAFRKLFTDNQASYHLESGQFAVFEAFRQHFKSKIYDIDNSSLRNELLALSDKQSYSQTDGWPVLSSELQSSDVRVGQKYKDSLPATDSDKSKPTGCLRSRAIVNQTTAYKKATARARQLMADSSVSAADRTLAATLLDDVSGTGEWAATVTYAWLGGSSLGALSFDKTSLPRQCALYLFALVGCGSTAESTARKLMKAKPATGSIPPLPTMTLTTLSQKDKRSTEADKARSIKGNLILTYASTQLQTSITAAIQVLAAGGYLNAGCLSGIDHESDHPPIEHYILIFANKDKQFLFWDPDTSATNIRSAASQLGPAIGILTYDTTDPSQPTFSTGTDFEDLKNVDPSGNHERNPQRHRYQIMTLAKI